MRELRHLGPIRMYISSGVKPGEIFMMLPAAAAAAGRGGGGGAASGGRHAPVERLACCPLGLQQSGRRQV